MKDCIFCKIIAGVIPSTKIYEDDHVLAFADINPATKGHTLLIPKTHCDDLFDMDSQLAAQVFSVVPKIAQLLKDTHQCAGLNLINNNGSVAGQMVFHWHLHLVPRYADDEFAEKFWAQYK